MTRSISIRVDGNSKIGLGHIVRCIALAHILKYDFEITFFCMYIPETIVLEILKCGFKLTRLDDENIFLGSVNNSSIVVLDGYHFTSDLHKRIKKNGAVLVCIDDINDNKIEFFADLIINHGPLIDSKVYLAQPYTKFALGLDYVLVRPAFQEQMQKQKRIAQLDTFLICFGGSDALNFTEKALRIVLNVKFLNRIIVITGAQYIPSEGFKILLSSEKRIDYRSSLNENQMLDSILESDLALVPASGILLEVLSVGVPAITGYYVTDQKNPALSFSKLGLTCNIGDFRKDFKNDLLNILKSITLRKAQKMVDIQKRTIRGSTKNLLNLFIEYKYLSN